MKRLISLFASADEDAPLGKPPDAPIDLKSPDYTREPEYFEHLLQYLREQRRSGHGPMMEAVAVSGEAAAGLIEVAP